MYNEWPSLDEFPSRKTPPKYHLLKKQLVASELYLKKEVFPFPGIKTASYLKLKKDDEEFPGFVTPIDELIHKFRNNGMRVVIGNHPKNPVIIPGNSTDIIRDSILPNSLLLTENIKGKLRELIRLDRILKNKK